MQSKSWTVSEENQTRVREIKTAWEKAGLWEKILPAPKEGKKGLYWRYDEPTMKLIVEMAWLRCLDKSAVYPTTDIVGIMSEIFVARIHRAYYSFDDFIEQFEVGLRENIETGLRLGDSGSDIDFYDPEEAAWVLIQVKGRDLNGAVEFWLSDKGLNNSTEHHFVRVNQGVGSCEMYLASKTSKVVKELIVEGIIKSPLDCLPSTKVDISKFGPIDDKGKIPRLKHLGIGETPAKRIITKYLSDFGINY